MDHSTFRRSSAALLLQCGLSLTRNRGIYTADAEGIPLTYTTVAGDAEAQVAARFGVITLANANRPTSGGGAVWYDFTIDGRLTAGQTISVSLDQPSNKPGLDS